MKRKTVIIIIIVAAFLVLGLFLPIPQGTYEDGGTRDYNALTYKIVVWNRLLGEANEDGSVGNTYTYHKTSVYWIPDNFKSIDELWKMEISRNRDEESTGDSSVAHGTYRIKYELGKTETHFSNNPSEARAGELVEINTNGILYDADIHVYVDGQEIGKTHYESDYWGYSFVMPDRDVLVTARFYTKDEIWGLGSDENALKEKYPEYFGLSTTKGLELYVWQMAPNSYSFGVLPGTNREKTLDEMWNMKGTTAEEMRIILSTYDIDQHDVCIIPWQNPISSYLPGYWIIQNGEDSAAVEKRQQEYIAAIRTMLFGSDDATKGWILLKEGPIKKITVTTLPDTGYLEVFEGEAVHRIITYISELNLIADFPEDPYDYFGLTWVISLDYESGENLTIHHFGNQFVRVADDRWYEITFEEASWFGELLKELRA